MKSVLYSQHFNKRLADCTQETFILNTGMVMTLLAVCRSLTRLLHLIRFIKRLTSSKMSSFSSRRRRSWRERRCGLWAGLSAQDRKVGVPSMLLTMGLSRPPRSNSWAEILRTGVVAPELAREAGQCVSGAQQPWGVAEWHTSHVSTTCRVAFLQCNPQSVKIPTTN